LNEAMQKRNLFSPWGNFTCYPLKNVIVQVWQVILWQVGHIR
jgi:hypothetical protein